MQVWETAAKVQYELCSEAFNYPVTWASNMSTETEILMTEAELITMR